MVKNKILVIIICLMNYFKLPIDVEINATQKYLYIPRISLVEQLSFDKTLDVGSQIHKISYDKNKPLVIMGHSGIGNNAIFNDLDKLSIGDSIYIYENEIKNLYEIDMIINHNKGEKFKVINNSKYIYLVTCDKENYQKQLIFRAKYQKNAKK